MTHYIRILLAALFSGFAALWALDYLADMTDKQLPLLVALNIACAVALLAWPERR